MEGTYYMSENNYSHLWAIRFFFKRAKTVIGLLTFVYTTNAKTETTNIINISKTYKPANFQVSYLDF